MDNLFSSVNQYADAAIPAATPLSDKTPMQGSRIRIEELPLMGHFNLRVNPADADAMAKASQAVGVDLPTQVLSSVQHNGVRVNWVSPDEWYVLMPREQAAGFEQAFRQALAGKHYSIVDVSGGQTAVMLTGAGARQTLMKGAAVDLHDDAMPINKVVGTAIAKSSGMIVRTDEQAYLLLIRRSFANYLWDWLSDAAQEFVQ